MTTWPLAVGSTGSFLSDTPTRRRVRDLTPSDLMILLAEPDVPIPYRVMSLSPMAR